MSKAVAEALPDEHEPIDVGVFVEMTFWFPRPKSVTREQKLTAPDTDKLARAVHDALTVAELYTDDSRVVGFLARKFYADEDHPAGVHIRAYID
jgi:Holliday junction resolvase RusA-like endonuclease